MRIHHLLSTLTLAFVATTIASADDWPNFRGPNHDGISGETGLKTVWTTPLELVWEREIGSAYSSFAAVDGKVYTCGTAKGYQVLCCLNADTGEVVWQKPIEKEYPDRQGAGTRATPTVDDGLVYIFGAHSTLKCFDANDGKAVWVKKFSKKPRWGYSGSVLIEGDLAIVSPGASHGGLLALNKKTGKHVWKSGKDIAGYATPYPFTFNDKRYIVGFMGRSAVIVEAETGKEVWSMPWKTSYDVNAAAPIFHDGHLFLSSGYDHGCILLKLRADGDGLAADEVWQKNVLRNKFQSPVLHDGHLYSGDEHNMRCVEFLTGEEKWQARTGKHATVVLADGHLFILTERGDLQIAKATPERFERLTSARILDGDRVWTIPMLYKGRVYARNFDRVVCFNLRG